MSTVTGNHTRAGRTLLRAGTAAAAVVVASSAAAGLAAADESTASTSSCSVVAHIGDSTSVAMNDSAYLDVADQMTTQYKAVGVEQVIDDSLGGRAIIERVNGGTSGEDVLNAVNAGTPAPDCYVIALGTNDAANVAVGSAVSNADRIAKVLELTGDKPVVWPTVKTTAAATAPGCQPESMTAFNDALNAAAADHPNLKVLDWAAEADDALFAPDGIHYSVEGTKARVKAFAAALGQIGTDSDSSTTTAPAAPSTTAPEDDGPLMPGYDLGNWPNY